MTKKKQRHSRWPVLAVTLISLLGGCASGSDGEIADPLEPFNRDVFKMNISLLNLGSSSADKKETQDGEIASDQGASADANADTETEVDSAPQDEGNVLGFIGGMFVNFVDYLATPLYLVNSILQGNGDAITANVNRITVNGVFGLGLADVATHAGIEKQPKDFGQTLAVWGVGEGAYLMLPIYGPTNVRDVTGRLIESLAIAPKLKVPNPIAGTLTYSQIDIVAAVFKRFDNAAAASESDDFATLLDNTSIDPYATVRSGYTQARRATYQSEEVMVEELPDIDDLF